jgi:hypothetical protein
MRMTKSRGPRMTRMDAKFNQEKIIRANSCDSRADLFFSLIPRWNALSLGTP